MTPATDAPASATPGRPPAGRSHDRAPSRGRDLLTALLVLAGVAALVSLGTWQLQRRVWKARLLHRIEALHFAPPEPLGVVLNRVADGQSLDFTRVMVRCEGGLGARSVHLYGLRDAGPGWRQIAACPLAGANYGSVLIDLGYTAAVGFAEPRAEPVSLPADAALTGVLRTPEPKPWFARLIAPTPRAADVGRFYERDIPGMATLLGAPRPAPAMLELERPAAGPGLTPSPLPTDIPNRHLEYALTWFGLAAALVGVWIATRLRRRRA